VRSGEVVAGASRPRVKPGLQLAVAGLTRFPPQKRGEV